MPLRRTRLRLHSIHFAQLGHRGRRPVGVQWSPVKLPAFAALCLLACENTGTYTYTRDVQPLFAAHCEACHQAGNIAPFALQSYADAMAHRLDIAADVQNGTMPPWPPDDTCNSYRGDRSLSADEINTIVTWANYPSEGDPTLAPARITEPAGMLSTSMPDRSQISVRVAAGRTA